MYMDSKLQHILTPLSKILQARLADTSWIWVQKQLELLRVPDHENVFYTAFSGAIRHAKNTPLHLDEKDLKALYALEEFGVEDGKCNLTTWSIDELLRVFFVCHLPISHSEESLVTYNHILDNLIDTADNRERIAYYKGLSLYPSPESHYERVRTGLRSNISAVFDAIALGNPYSSKHLKEDAWNQMVLKALFIGTPLHKIQNLDQRANPRLKDMLLEYANERRAAGRRIYPSLWRCVGPFANQEELLELETAYNSEDENERKGAGLALLSSKEPFAQSILNSNPNLEYELKSHAISWHTIKWENLYYD
jgi:hypothetical protein